MSVGLDWGTSTVIASRRVPKKDEAEKLEVRTREQRNCYLPLLKTDAIMKIIESSKINVVDLGKDDYIYAIGDDAINLANTMSKEVERPMQAGVLQGDLRALRIMQAIANSVLSQPKEENESVVYSVPANPIDKNMNIMHHRGMAKKALETLGWKAEPINEGLAVIYATNPIANIDGQECKFTGIGVSCLCPDVKIYTNRGILPIKEVQIEDEVITHKGRYRKIKNIITKEFSGTMTKIQVIGYSNNTNEYKFVDNHEIYVNRDGKWNWIGCEYVKEGDIIGEPIINQNRDSSSLKMVICNKTTSSKNIEKQQIDITQDVQRLIGYFLGDGSICERGEGIQIDFSINEKEFADDAASILLKNFSKSSTQIDKDNDGTVIRLKCYSKGIAKYFKNKFYDENKNKIYPFDIARLRYSDCVNLLTGLIRSDGSIKNDQITFCNTSTNLVILAKQLFSRIGIPASINYREPRENYSNNISGKKQSWGLSSGSKKCFYSLNDFIKNISCENSQIMEKMFIENGFCCSRIQKIEKEYYSGVVYDLQVEDDHSFSGPFMTIHNCGGGMINVCVAYKGLDTLSFSLANALGNNQGSSGDWIDKRLFDAYGAQFGSESRCVIYKENYANLTRINDDIFGYAEEVSNQSNLVPGDVDWHFQVLTALQIFYENLMDYVIDNICREFNDKKPSLNGALDFVIAGGTSIPEGFEDIFKQRLDRKKLPFKIGNVIKAKDPKYAVTKGCLAAAEAGYSSE